MNDGLFDLSGQVAIVTGTSRGLGQYFARALAKAGADLLLTSRTRESLAPCAARKASKRWPPMRRMPTGRFTSW